MADRYHREPTQLKALHGNPGKRRLPTNEPQGQGLLWSPPAYFDDEQRAEWHYALEFAPPGLLSATDRGFLVVWCVASVEHARAVVEVRKLGQVVKTKDGNAIQNPFLPIVNRQALIMMRAGADLGFSPASRASLGSAAPEFTSANRSLRGRSGGLAEYLDANPDRLQ
jgi:P27 family predicted phage terminase small subunit